MSRVLKTCQQGSAHVVWGAGSKSLSAIFYRSSSILPRLSSHYERAVVIMNSKKEYISCEW